MNGIIEIDPTVDFACKRTAPSKEQQNLLVVAQVFTWLRYKDKDLLQRLGGRKMITDSELIQEVVQEAVQEAVQEKGVQSKIEDILMFLETRFESLPSELLERLHQVQDETKLKHLIRRAASCHNVAAFLDELPVSPPN